MKCKFAVVALVVGVSCLAPSVFGQRFSSVTKQGFLVASAYAPDRVRRIADFRCDGVHDEVEIQAAIDALPDTIGYSQSQGGIIQLSQGKFNIGAPIYLRKQCCTIQGMGVQATILRMADNVNADMFRYSYTVQSTGWLTVRDLLADGNKENNATSGCWLRTDRTGASATWDGTALTGTVTKATPGVITGVSDITQFSLSNNAGTGTRVKFSAGVTDATKYYDVTAINAASNTFTCNLPDAETLAGSAAATITLGSSTYDTHLSHMFITNFRGDGIRTTQGWGWVIEHVVVEFCGGDGLHIEGYSAGVTTQGPKLYGCKFITNRGHGIYCKNMSGGLFTSTELQGGLGKAGVFFDAACAGNVVTGCSFLAQSGTTGASEDGPCAGVWLGSADASTNRNVINGCAFRDGNLKASTAGTSQDSSHSIINVVSTTNLSVGSIVALTGGGFPAAPYYITSIVGSTVNVAYFETMTDQNPGVGQSGSVTIQPIHICIAITKSAGNTISGNGMQIGYAANGHKTVRDAYGVNSYGIINAYDTVASKQLCQTISGGVVTKTPSGNVATITIAHKLASDIYYTGKTVVVTPANAATQAIAWYVSAVDATNITLTAPSQFQSGTAYSWYVYAAFTGHNNNDKPVAN